MSAEGHTLKQPVIPSMSEVDIIIANYPGEPLKGNDGTVYVTDDWAIKEITEWKEFEPDTAQLYVDTTNTLAPMQFEVMGYMLTVNPIAAMLTDPDTRRIILISKTITGEPLYKAAIPSKDALSRELHGTLSDQMKSITRAEAIRIEPINTMVVGDKQLIVTDIGSNIWEFGEQLRKSKSLSSD